MYAVLFFLVRVQKLAYEEAAKGLAGRGHEGEVFRELSFGGVPKRADELRTTCALASSFAYPTCACE